MPATFLRFSERTKVRPRRGGTFLGQRFSNRGIRLPVVRFSAFFPHEPMIHEWSEYFNVYTLIYSLYRVIRFFDSFQRPPRCNKNRNTSVYPEESNYCYREIWNLNDEWTHWSWFLSFVLLLDRSILYEWRTRCRRKLLRSEITSENVDYAKPLEVFQAQRECNARGLFVLKNLANSAVRNI